MPIDRLAPDQVLNRQARLTTPLFGQIDLITMAEIADATSTTTMPTGQVRATGQPQAVDVVCTIMFADKATLARVEKWKRLAKAGAVGGVQYGVAVQYYLESGLPGPALILEESFVHTVTYPSTDVAATGDAAQVSFTLSCFNTDALTS